MHNTKKPTILNYLASKLILAIINFAFITNINAAILPNTDTPVGNDDGTQFTQKVYLADKPLPQIIAKLKQEGKSEEQISQHLHKLPLITYKLAKQKFNISWKDNSKHLSLKYALPDLAICYMGPEIGYGLFTMQYVRDKTRIAEYTGKMVSLYDADEISGPYAFPYHKEENMGIDATHEGNAARFAQHFMCKEMLDYHYAPINRSNSFHINNEPVTANSCIAKLGDSHVVLWAMKNIEPYTQIGYIHSDYYGFEFDTWTNEPVLYNTNAEIITNKYRQKKVIAIHDEISNESIHAHTTVAAYKEKLFYIKTAANFGAKTAFIEVKEDETDFFKLLSSLSSFSAKKDENDKEISIIDGYMIIKSDSDPAKRLFLSPNLSIKNGHMVINYEQIIRQLKKPRKWLSILCCALPPDTNLNKFIELLKEIDQYNLPYNIRRIILKKAKNNEFISHEEIEKIAAKYSINENNSEEIEDLETKETATNPSSDEPELPY
jgi:hypothetical protein